MGVIKNDVGRPSNKTIMIRNILKVIVILVIIVVTFAAGYYLKDNEDIKNNKNNNKNVSTSIKSEEKLNVDDELVVDLFNKYNLYTNWLNIYVNEEVNHASYEKYSKEFGELWFTYFYDSNEIKNVNDAMKFAVSIGNLYMKEETLENALGETSKEKVLDIIVDKNIDFEIVNNKSIELFGSEIDIKNILDDKNNIIVAVMANSFKYNPKSNTIKSVGGGIGDAASEDFYTKIIDAKKIDNKIEITNKVMHVSCLPDGIDCYISKEKQDINNIKNTISTTSYNYSKENSDILIDKYADKLYSYKWTFVKNEDGNYIFDKVEKVK